MPLMRAQNDFLRDPPSGCGALRLLPVAALYLALPFAVNPAPLEAGSFSPRPTESDGVFLGLAIEHHGGLDVCDGHVNVSIEQQALARQTNIRR